MLEFWPAALLTLGWLALPAGPAAGGEEGRGTRPLASAVVAGPAFHPAGSAGLFVGIAQFDDIALTEVPFAADDAVDLAHFFALESRLLAPERVRLLLAGEPKKDSSKKRLAALLRAGARRSGAGKTEIYEALGAQADQLAPADLWIVAFATHGFHLDGQHFLATRSTLLRRRDTALAVADLDEELRRSGSGKRIVFLDTCRQELMRTGRGPGPATPESLMGREMMEALGRAEGQAVIAAAPPGTYAYDDPGARNGVFTAALLEGLRCKAPVSAEGWVTLHGLAAYLNEAVDRWVEREQGPAARHGIDVRFAGRMADLPIARCRPPRPPDAPEKPAPATDPEPFQVQIAGAFATLRNSLGEVLAIHRVDGTLTVGTVADLDQDGHAEVLLAVSGWGADTGKILALDGAGRRIWSYDATAVAANYAGGHSGRFAIEKMEIARLLDGSELQIAAIAIDAQGWYPSRLLLLDARGRLLGDYWHPGHLHHLVLRPAGAAEGARILVAGVNNDLVQLFGLKFFPAVVAAFRPENLTGEGPPFFGFRRAQGGSHIFYRALITTTFQEVSRVQWVDPDRDGRLRLSVWTNKGHIVYLDEQGGELGRVRQVGAEGELGPLRILGNGAFGR